MTDWPTCSCPVPDRHFTTTVVCGHCGKPLGWRWMPPADPAPNQGAIVERWIKGKRVKMVVQENGALRRLNT